MLVDIATTPGFLITGETDDGELPEGTFLNPKSVIDDTPPKKFILLEIPFFIISSYLFFDIPYFLHNTFGYGYCDTGGPCTRLFDNVPNLMPWIGLSAMLNWWLMFGFLNWALWTGRWDPMKPKGQQWTSKPLSKHDRMLIGLVLVAFGIIVDVFFRFAFDSSALPFTRLFGPLIFVIGTIKVFIAVFSDSKEEEKNKWNAKEEVKKWQEKS